MELYKQQYTQTYFQFILIQKHMVYEQNAIISSCLALQCIAALQYARMTVWGGVVVNVAHIHLLHSMSTVYLVQFIILVCS